MLLTQGTHLKSTAVEKMYQSKVQKMITKNRRWSQQTLMRCEYFGGGSNVSVITKGVPLSKLTLPSQSTLLRKG